VASVRLILRVVASKTAGGRLDFRVPVIAITQTGTISLGADGELAHELTHTLRLGLAPVAT
jgi:hypothetical protein